MILAWDTDPAHPVSTAERLASHFSHADLHVATAPAAVERWAEEVAHFLADCD